MLPVYGIVGIVATGLGWTAFIARLASFARGFAAGAPELPGSRTNRPWARTRAMFREFLAHTKMRRLPLVAAAHWLTMVSFLVLVATLAQATGQLFDASFELPVIGGFAPYGWITEFFAWAGLIGIAVLITIRARASRGGRRSRFFGSHQWRARYVEATILAVCALVLWLRGLEAALQTRGPESMAPAFRFPTTAWIGDLYQHSPDSAIEHWIPALALAKILVSYAWMAVVALTPTMGVAWPRFLAFFAIWTAKNPTGAPALGPLEPIVVDAKPVDLQDPDTDEAVFERLGAGAAADLTWRDLLALATCTECGRCQDVCPAWDAGKPLSPKLLIESLRDHAFAEWPVNRPQNRPKTQAGPTPLIGGDAPWAIPEEALWACTTCGACTAVCPVSIEHVDHVIDLRRRRVLGDAEFPPELAAAFRHLERRQNPWGIPAKQRLDWAAALDFDVQVLGRDVASLDQVDYLYWVGCAGAFDPRGQATARAFATLLHRAGVSFAVLGPNETCTGDPARRAGHEALFAELAARATATLNRAHATKIVVTCAHCLNTLRGEFAPFGGTYQVVHHTELLARLVREGRLSPGHLPTDDAGTEVSVTYQDPCYLARHNGQVAAPRELLGAIGNLKLTEMPRCGREAQCCGAGGGCMWMDDGAATRPSRRRADQALATGASTVATACPFCSTMLGDAFAGDGPEMAVQDVACLVLSALPAPGERAGGKDPS
ncbi:MAG: (Fe-S)-binding protein [Bifidobacteriaceae bacterium]|nr:(Fe-S)-binding protein [Bifidobacteriaceae bacterium]